ncbi:MAG: redoxin domain-containing protein [Longimicrobiales bacterium]
MSFPGRRRPQRPGAAVHAPAARRPRWRVWVDVAFWLGLVALLLYRFGPQIGAAAGIGGEARPAPAVRIRTLAGDEIALADLRGEVVLVNFWATWCGPCRIEMPGLQNVYDEYRDRGFTIIGLSLDIGAPDLVRDFVATFGLTFPIGTASAATRRAFGGPPALPTSYLIDREGRVRHTVRGIFAQPALEQAVRRLLADSTASAATPRSGLRSRFDEDCVQRRHQPVRIGSREHEWRLDLQHVVIGAVGAQQDPAVAHAVGNV